MPPDTQRRGARAVDPILPTTPTLLRLRRDTLARSSMLLTMLNKISVRGGPPTLSPSEEEEVSAAQCDTPSSSSNPAPTVAMSTPAAAVSVGSQSVTCARLG